MICQGLRYAGVYIPLTDQGPLYLSIKKWFLESCRAIEPKRMRQADPNWTFFEPFNRTVKRGQSSFANGSSPVWGAKPCSL
jgi:hypothetical protein